MSCCGGGWKFMRRPFLRPVIVLPDAYELIGRTARKRLRAAMQYALLGFVFLIVVLWFGAEIQEYHVKKAPETLSYYTTPKVCGITISHQQQNQQQQSQRNSNHNVSSTSNSNNIIISGNRTTNSSTTSSNNSSSNGTTTATSSSTLLIQTFESSTDALESPNTLVAHCGDCGQCSNPQDVLIYDATKNSLFGDTVYCAKKALVWGRKTAGSCMKEAVGFTAGCNDCWVENIMCDLRYCLFICLWYGLFNQVEDSGRDAASAETLNRCTVCDEKRCGPAFIECAGSNRRRSGIASDIERDQELEVCQAVTPPLWWNDPNLQETWQQYQQQQQPNHREELHD